jgi:hypothetical protein
LPSWATFFDIDDALTVVVCGCEGWRHIENALAYGIAHADARALHLLLPAWPSTPTCDPVRATVVRAAFLDLPVRVWTHDGTHVRPVEPMDRAAALCYMREDPLAIGTFDTSFIPPRVQQLADLRDPHRALSVVSRRSYWTLRCQGLIVLKVHRTGTKVTIKAGVQYGQENGRAKLPATYELTDRDLTDQEDNDIRRRVAQAVTDKLAGHPPGYLEHWLQSTLARHPDQVGWSRRGLQGEFPARRAGYGRGYVDFLRLDDTGTLHIVETKIGHDEMLILQGLDYWIWANANQDSIESYFRSIGENPDGGIRHIVIDYVLGATDGQATPTEQPLPKQISPYSPAQLEALTKDIDWETHLLAQWNTHDQRQPRLTPLRRHVVPKTPRIHPH